MFPRNMKDWGSMWNFDKRFVHYENSDKRFGHYEIFTWTLCLSFLYEKQRSRIQSLSESVYQVWSLWDYAFSSYTSRLHKYMKLETNIPTAMYKSNMPYLLRMVHKYRQGLFNVEPTIPCKMVNLAGELMRLWLHSYITYSVLLLSEKGNQKST